MLQPITSLAVPEADKLVQRNIYRISKMRYLIVLACLLIVAAEALATEVTFPGAVAEGYPQIAEVSGYLVFPTGEAKGRVPAVVILHGSGGIDGRGEFHAKALNAAGIATLEALMFTSGNRPRDGSRSNFTHMYGALNYLANRPDIDRQRIGVMGFSWGGGLSLSSTTLALTQRFTGGQLRFAAHAPFYPVCWPYLRLVSDPKAPGYGTYKKLTGAPVLVFAGGEDDYDEPDTCQKFIASLPEEARSHVSLKYYPKATHGWDSQERAKVFHDDSAWLGRGGKVRMTPDPEIAEDSRRTAVEFFVRHLAPR
jgi:dienelactone hydrolase